MNKDKHIQNHIDKMMKDAEKPSEFSVSSDFEENLFARFDAIDAQKEPKQATIFSLTEFQKYAAVIIFLILNISVILFYSTTLEEPAESENFISEYSDQYFPDYAILTSLE